MRYEHILLTLLAGALVAGCSSEMSPPAAVDLSGDEEPLIDPYALLLLDGLHEAAVDVADNYYIRFSGGRRNGGYSRLRRQRVGRYVVITRWHCIIVNRGYYLSEYISRTQEVSHLDGRPLCFLVNSAGVGGRRHTEGQIRQSVLEIRETQGDAIREWTVDWPHDAVLRWGEMVLTESLADGESVSFQAFWPTFLDFVQQTSFGAGTEVIETSQGQQMAIIRRDLVVRGDGYTSESKMWLSADNAMLRFETLGQTTPYSAVLSDAETALAEYVPEEVVGIRFLPCPVDIPADSSAVTMVVGFADNYSPPAHLLPTSCGPQTITVNDDTMFTVEYRLIQPLADSPPGQPLDNDAALYLRATRLVQSDDPRIIATTRDAIGDATTEAKMAQRIAAWISENITYDLTAGYRNASDTLQNRRGACEEMACLAAAMCRASGIPSRIVHGMIYGNKSQGFWAHAWTQILVGGQWVDLDASYPPMHRSAGRMVITVSDSLDRWNPQGMQLMEKMVIRNIRVD